MASIFKRSKRKNTPYTIQYTDHDGNRKTELGFSDKGLTEQLASKLETEARLRRTGMIDAEQEKFVGHRNSPIQPHLDAFKLSLGDNSAKHVKLTMTRINRIITDCEIQRLADITIELMQQGLRAAREEDGFGHRTYNHYIQAMDSFLNWCVPSRLIVNPIMGMERLNVETDVRHKRRSLTGEEVQKLINSARDSDCLIQCFNGEQRARIYIMSYMTGLRRAEIASLTPRSFSLDDEIPTISVEAIASKHKKKDVLPLHPELCEMVRDWMKGMKPGQHLFPKLAKRRTWLMVKKDLERVGILYENEDGIADFHAAGRHTHITELLRNGATLPEAQKLARHSDIKQTIKYTHIGLNDQAKAVANLPGLALHGRCISGVAGSHSVAQVGKKAKVKECLNPGENQGLDTVCQPLASADNLEAAGIE